ncbi:trypsin-like peptidase domain-containing protein [Candidatus Gracilibacteria bacterium]|nr:trypsin-like peptidase domain-containing protein [Candidatus Gracilibacteria bacterium]NJP19657.1 trypsin-like peptidase domain-containing protein [Hydrococcus sp. CRU_1_1]
MLSLSKLFQSIRLSTRIANSNCNTDFKRKIKNKNLVFPLSDFCEKSILASIAIALYIQPVLASETEVKEAAQKITVRIEGTARGSGVMVERRGQTYTVLTNAHVLQNVGTYTVVAPDGKCYSIKPDTIRALPDLDLAVFLFKSAVPYSVARLGDSKQLTASQTVYVGGWANSGGMLQSRVFFTSPGQLTEVDSQLPSGYSLSYTNLVRVGMSGGPVLDQESQLVGINGLIRLNDEDAIVGSGIKIEQFQQWHSQIVKTIPLPSASAIACPRNYIN